jgi:fructose-1,6-bisphosphatase/inositol monophosphatase family enzyme
VDAAEYDTLTRKIEIDRLAQILREAAEVEIMPRFRALAAEDVREKSSAIDLVTVADETAERFIKAECAKLFPGAIFIGEESAAANPALLDSLRTADTAIVVDPIDGTANFAAGMPLFAVMAAVVANGETVAGILYDPVGQDFVVAAKGGGAFLERKGKRTRIGVAQPVAVENMVGTGSVNMFPIEERRKLFGKLAEVRVFANYRNAGHEYWSMATGHLHFCFYKKLMPWDHLAGCLIVEEGGGYARKLDGSPYRVTDREGGLLVTTDEASWQALHATLFR